MVTRVILALVSGVFCGVTSLQGAADSTPTEVVEVEADPVQRQAGYTVITRQELEQTGEALLVEALGHLPGVHILRNGGLGTATSVYLRGADPQHILVLINGLRLSDPSESSISHNTHLSSISVAEVLRIEVSRGPRSIVHGSDALAGVINIITRSGAQDHQAAQLRVTNRASRQINGYYGTKAAPFGVRVGGQFLDDNSRSRYKPFSSGTEKDGLTSQRWSTGLSLYGKRVQWDLDHLYNIDEVELDKFGGDDPDYSEWRLDNKTASRLRGQSASGELVWELGLAHNRSRRRYKDGSLPVGSFSFNTNYLGDSQHMRAQLGYAHNWGTTYLGMDRFSEWFRQRSPDATGEYSTQFDKQQSQHGIFLLHEGHITESVELSLGHRTNTFDDQDKHRQIAVNSAEVRYVAHLYTTYASYGEGFKRPGLDQKFSQTLGNPDLESQRSRSRELGFMIYLPFAMDLGFDYYERYVSELITYDLVAERYTNAPGVTKTFGREINLNWQPYSNLHTVASYEWMQSRLGGEDEQRLRRPERKTQVQLVYTHSYGTSLQVSGQYVGPRRDLSRRLPSYRLYNAQIAQELSQSTEVSLSVTNLMNSNYLHNQDHRGEPRTFSVGLSWHQ